MYKIKNKNVFILIEHQSSVDYKMSYRIMRYKYAIIESAIDKKRLKEKSYRIPMVIPVVLYTDKRKWKRLLINDIEEKVEGYAENWLEYTLIDVNKFSKEQLLADNLIITKAIAPTNSFRPTTRPFTTSSSWATKCGSNPNTLLRCSAHGVLPA